jgi:hypothetical protein
MSSYYINNLYINYYATRSDFMLQYCKNKVIEFDVFENEKIIYSNIFYYCIQNNKLLIGYYGLMYDTAFGPEEILNSDSSNYGRFLRSIEDTLDLKDYANQITVGLNKHLDNCNLSFEYEYFKPDSVYKYIKIAYDCANNPMYNKESCFIGFK